MEMKEAIKWIFDIWHEWENVYGVDGEQVLKEGKKMDEVIKLLKRGEKFEVTIIEIAKIADKEIYPYANDGERLKYILEEIEIMNKGGRKKYFPKEVADNETEIS